jgi:hypothetical protein
MSEGFAQTEAMASRTCREAHSSLTILRLTYMQYLNMLSKGLVGEALDQKEKESAAYLECVSTPQRA